MTRIPLIQVNSREEFLEFQNRIDAFPNPFQDDVNFQISKGSVLEEFSLKFYNSHGHLVKSTYLNGEISCISLGYLEKGVYYFYLYGETISKKGKLIKLH